VGFKQRERRRKMKAATTAAQLRSRENRSSVNKWWLTPLEKTGCCAECGLILRAGKSEGVYRHEPRELLCVPCADRRRIFYRPSLRWERKRAA
jgi:hypothetical protein